MNVPKRGSFVIGAQAQRYITLIDWNPITEHYYWLQPVSLGGQQQLTQNLSNNNLTSTTGLRLSRGLAGADDLLLTRTATTEGGSLCAPMKS